MSKFKFHPKLKYSELWPGPNGYPWAENGIRLWTREAILRRTGSGKLICTWTTGGFTEPTVGNFTMFSRSDDNGDTWSKPEILFRHPFRGLFTTELFVTETGAIHAFLQTYDNGSWMCHLQSYRSISIDGGVAWTIPHSIPVGIDNVWVNQGILHSSGRWIIPVSWAEHVGEEWAEPVIGRSPVECIVGGKPAKHKNLPYGADTMYSQLEGNAWADRNYRYVCGVITSDNQGGLFNLRGYVTGGRHGHLIEPKIIELSNGHIAMLIRSQQDDWLWRSDSADGGNSWTEAVKTDIPNPSAKVKLLKSKDNRIFLIHNPSNSLGNRPARRNPLSLWVSSDDMKTWSMKVDLVCNSTDNPDEMRSLNYPEGYIDEERGELVFVWEDAYRVYFNRLPLDLKNV
jgi:hypothetical protein